MNLKRALRRDGVSREVGQASAGTKHDDTPLLQVTDRPQRQIGFSDLGHRNRSLNACGNTRLVDEVLEGQRIHDGSEHAHVVGAGTLQALTSQLRAAEEVATTDDNRNLHALAHGTRHLLSNIADDLGIQADRPTSKCLSGKLEQNAALRRHDASPL